MKILKHIFILLSMLAIPLNFMAMNKLKAQLLDTEVAEIRLNYILSQNMDEDSELHEIFKILDPVYENFALGHGLEKEYFKYLFKKLINIISQRDGYIKQVYVSRYYIPGGYCFAISQYEPKRPIALFPIKE